MHNATIQQPLTMMSLNSNPTILVLQAEAGFISKHVNYSIAHDQSTQSRVNQVMDELRTFHSAANGIKWYEQTLNYA
ncbi:hypothetical protein TNCV_2167021 [Trichonephila clavipes]|nr:hypothetical protein TNCV_2167021 [Trichonephila clavipes]